MNHIFLVVEAPHAEALRMAELRGIRVHLADPGAVRTVLAADMADFDRIRDWWLEPGMTLRFTFGSQQAGIRGGLD